MKLKATLIVLALSVSQLAALPLYTFVSLKTTGAASGGLRYVLISFINYL